MLDLLSTVFSPPGASVARGAWDDYWYTGAGALQNAAGMHVSPETAYGLAVVFTCIRIRSETVGMLPLNIFEHDGRKKKLVAEHPWYRILHTRPNPWQTSTEFREMMTGHRALRGNAFARKIYNPLTGAPEALIPLSPERSRWKIEQAGDTAELVYTYRNRQGDPETYLQDELLHLRFLSSDSYWGLSVVDLLKETFGGALAMRTYANKLHEQGARPSGVLQTDTKLSPEAKKRLLDNWQEIHGGVQNAAKTAVLEDGLKWQQLSMSAEDLQSLESRKLSRAEICGVFRVPAHMVNDLEKATFSNIEELGMEFIVFNMMPEFVYWEQMIDANLIRDDEPNIHAKFDVRQLLRGDATSRAAYAASGIQWGWLTRNEAREIEDLDPIDGLDEPIMPANMVSGLEAPDAAEPGDVVDKSAPALPPGRPVKSMRLAAIIRETAAYLVRKEIGNIRRRSRLPQGVEGAAWEAWLGEFYQTHAAEIATRLQLAPCEVDAYCSEQRAALAAGGIAVIETWERDRPAALARLVLEEVFA